MAEYGRDGTAADWMRENEFKPDPKRLPYVNPNKVGPSETSIIQTKTTRITEVEFPVGKLTLEHMREFVKATADLPEGSTLEIKVAPVPGTSSATMFKIIVTGGQ